MYGSDQNRDRGQNDHCPFKSRREKRDSLVSIQELRGCRFGAEPQAEDGEPNRHHVDYGFSRVGENSRGVGYEVSCDFAHQHEHADDQRYAHGEAHLAIVARLCESLDSSPVLGRLLLTFPLACYSEKEYFATSPETHDVTGVTQDLALCTGELAVTVL